MFLWVVYGKKKPNLLSLSQVDCLKFLIPMVCSPPPHRSVINQVALMSTLDANKPY